ncbi:hypothetical protein EVJ32_04565 [Exiguobacterium sp. SH5S4]|uniref:AAA family ATPase n=1 Tax=Exiguobacterium sp. SH5S4 TaxID=2510961 RepID=UPI001038AADA|nr:AAA family ATPase [Exiguobacterium sp. SH5S4]TCI26650.1 hypothetical protein EVJ32_04565 [Exiguobacterium sp. SH5S4]
MKQETKQLEITKISYVSDDKRFYIYQTKEVDTRTRATLKGYMPEFSVGMVVECYVKETSHPTYGKQYEPISFVERSPQTPQEKLALMSLFLTENQVKEFMEVYKKPFDIFKEVETDSLRWEEVKGFGRKNYNTLVNKVKNRKGGAIISAKLTNFGVNAQMGEQLLKRYGSVDRALEIIADNPYVLTNFRGLGFKTVDPIALKMGVPEESVYRITSAARYITKENEQSGSTYMSKKAFIDEMFDLLSIPVSRINEVNLGNDIHIDEERKTVAFQNTYFRETFTSEFIADYVNRDVDEFPLNDEQVDAFIVQFEKKNEVTFTEQQKKFFYAVKDHTIVCLLGYAGTGKSMLQKALVQMVDSAGWAVTLTAPTGRAAKLLQEYTGVKAGTLHSKLGIGVDKDEKDAEYSDAFIEEDFTAEEDDKEPYAINEEVFVADEFSMTDTEIMYHIAKNKGIAKRFVFIGDPEQLPSVGAGKVLLDLTQNGVKTIELTKVFRQAEGGILDLATRARQKQKLVSENNGASRLGSDTIFHQTSKEKIKKAVIVYMKKLTEKIDLSDITVISPTNKGDIGVQELNKEIQNEFNPHNPISPEIEFAGYTYRIGDPILITDNTPNVLLYHSFQQILFVKQPDSELTAQEIIKKKTMPPLAKLEKSADKAKLFNGEIGKVVGIHLDSKTLYIDVNGVTYAWERKLFKNSSLGYAMTVHKMQGSSNKAVIFVADKSNTYMLNRQLVYTAITRARERLVIIGTGYTINGSVKRDGSIKRKTMLGELISEKLTKSKSIKGDNSK